METVAQKSARLRALREARDGTPAERRAATRTAAEGAARDRSNRRIASALAGLDRALAQQDRPAFHRIIAPVLKRL